MEVFGKLKNSKFRLEKTQNLCRIYGVRLCYLAILNNITPLDSGLKITGITIVEASPPLTFILSP